MYLGTQIRPRDDSDYRVWAQLGVTHVCVDPPGNPHDWSQDDLNRQREHVEKFGLTLDMVQLPLASRPVEEAESRHILLGKDPERQRELDSICRLIERIGAAGIPAAKYNFNLIGIPRTAHEAGRGGSRNAAFRWRDTDQSAAPGLAGTVSEDANWSVSTPSWPQSCRWPRQRRCGWHAIRTIPTRRPATRASPACSARSRECSAS
jgi:mannonate dehydratase